MLTVSRYCPQPEGSGITVAGVVAPAMRVTDLTLDLTPSQRMLPVRSSLLLALTVALCSCSANDPDIDLPQAGLSGPGEGDLTQTVSLDGRYIDTIRIAPEGWQNIAPGQQMTITFEATGLAQVKQFEIVVQPQPSSAFSLEDALFRPQAPFITPFATGIQMDADGSLRLGGASLATIVTGDQVLGTLTLSTRSGLGSSASLRVTLVSVGPSSTDRERYEGDNIRLGVRVN